ncbi:MAG: SAM-dependent methyltransferase [Pseudomonadota bacterium]
MPDSARHSLPEPDALSAAHEDVVREHIAEKILASGGNVPFSEYMALALYAPGIGYYTAGSTKFGAVGDFITAPERGNLFAKVLARQCAAVISETGGDIIEFGAGSGRLAAGVLAALEKRDALPETYRIVEVSADLRDRQRSLLMRRVPELVDRVRWDDTPPTASWAGVAIGNEVLDALPVERFRIAADGVQQLVVGCDDLDMKPRWAPASTALAGNIEQLQRQLGQRLPEGYESEYCMMLEAWLRAAAGRLKRGAVLFSDYGYGRNDYYGAERTRGTLTCHFRHHVHDDAFINVGIQDITAWVDFSRTAEALDAAGLDYIGYTTQSQFLLGGGLVEMLEERGRDRRIAAEARELTLPGGMGERFRVMGFARGLGTKLTGFSGRDFGGRL